MVDGTHPNDLGMMHYAEAYERALRNILDQPIGEASTTRPRTQYREPDNYDWEDRHRAILEMNETSPPETVIFANSIIHFWGGLPRAKIVKEEASWKQLYTPMGVRNYAFGWDRLENVLWRIYHDELEGFESKKVVVMIGTNNLHLNTNKEILEGLRFITAAIRKRQPQSRVILIGIIPRRDYEQRIIELNRGISRLAMDAGVEYRDIGAVFLGEDHKIQERLFSDGLHPNEQGYQVMKEPMRLIFSE